MCNASSNRNDGPGSPICYLGFCSDVEIHRGIVVNLGGAINIINSILSCDEFTMVDDEGVDLIEGVIDCSLGFIGLQLLIGSCVEEVVREYMFNIFFMFQNTLPKAFVQGEYRKLFIVT
jgi:hypothetical protein